jgi:hypothetical protein
VRLDDGVRAYALALNGVVHETEAETHIQHVTTRWGENITTQFDKRRVTQRYTRFRKERAENVVGQCKQWLRNKLQGCDSDVKEVLERGRNVLCVADLLGVEVHQRA